MSTLAYWLLQPRLAISQRKHLLPTIKILHSLTKLHVPSIWKRIAWLYVFNDFPEKTGQCTQTNITGPLMWTKLSRLLLLTDRRCSTCTRQIRPSSSSPAVSKLRSAVNELGGAVGNYNSFYSALEFVTVPPRFLIFHQLLTKLFNFNQSQLACWDV